MSQLGPGTGMCPRCQAAWSSAVFSSLDADTIPAQVDAILDGTFELRACTACAFEFRPEHPMLFVSHVRRLWIVMHPLTDRREYTTLEPAVEATVVHEIVMAAPLVGDRLHGVRPRLVFGQHMLTEAVRAVWAGLDTNLLEIAKLLTIRRNLPALMAYGPFELCFERFDDGNPVCAIHALPDGARLGEFALARDVFAEAVAGRSLMQQRFPALFERAYASATRYLIGTTL
ncbi:MAG: CpXC domain-containing protein [Proteobacteria bacterium]|nr:CpXC domain-containing protein [Pseudomonadota bacterium]